MLAEVFSATLLHPMMHQFARKDRARVVVRLQVPHAIRHPRYRKARPCPVRERRSGISPESHPTDFCRRAKRFSNCVPPFPISSQSPEKCPYAHNDSSKSSRNATSRKCVHQAATALLRVVASRNDNAFAFPAAVAACRNCSNAPVTSGEAFVGELSMISVWCTSSARVATPRTRPLLQSPGMVRTAWVNQGQPPCR